LMIRIAIDKIAEANRGLRNKELTNDDWNFFKLLLYFLEVFKEISIEMESSKYPTLSSVILLYNSLIDYVEDWENDQEKPKESRNATAFAKEKLLEYYNHTSEINIIVTVLDPQLKLDYFINEN
ncbi:38345_t:CDS:1, partial [Gigaspora margarita]